MSDPLELASFCEERMQRLVGYLMSEPRACDATERAEMDLAANYAVVAARLRDMANR